MTEANYTNGTREPATYRFVLEGAVRNSYFRETTHYEILHRMLADNPVMSDLWPELVECFGVDCVRGLASSMKEAALEELDKGKFAPARNAVRWSDRVDRWTKNGRWERPEQASITSRYEIRYRDGQQYIYEPGDYSDTWQ